MCSYSMASDYVISVLQTVGLMGLSWSTKPQSSFGPTIVPGDLLLLINVVQWKEFRGYVANYRPQSGPTHYAPLAHFASWSSCNESVVYAWKYYLPGSRPQASVKEGQGWT